MTKSPKFAHSGFIQVLYCAIYTLNIFEKEEIDILWA